MRDRRETYEESTAASIPKRSATTTVDDRVGNSDRLLASTLRTLRSPDRGARSDVTALSLLTASEWPENVGVAGSWSEGCARAFEFGESGNESGIMSTAADEVQGLEKGSVGSLSQTTL